MQCSVPNIVVKLALYFLSKLPSICHWETTANVDVAQDAYSPYYNMAADALITLGTFLYQTLFQF